MKIIKESSGYENLTKSDFVIKNKIVDLLKKERHELYALIVSTMRVECMPTNQQGTHVAYTTPNGTLVINPYITDDELPTIVRHEILHNYLNHFKREKEIFIDYHRSKGEVISDEDVDEFFNRNLTDGVHQLFNIAFDYEISNKGYTPNDKRVTSETGVHIRDDNYLKYNANIAKVVRGLVTEVDHPDWINMTADEMFTLLYDEYNKDKEAFQRALNNLLDNKSIIDDISNFGNDEQRAAQEAERQAGRAEDIANGITVELDPELAKKFGKAISQKMQKTADKVRKKIAQQKAAEEQTSEGEQNFPFPDKNKLDQDATKAEEQAQEMEDTAKQAKSEVENEIKDLVDAASDQDAQNQEGDRSQTNGEGGNPGSGGKGSAVDDSALAQIGGISELIDSDYFKDMLEQENIEVSRTQNKLNPWAPPKFKSTVKNPEYRKDTELEQTIEPFNATAMKNELLHFFSEEIEMHKERDSSVIRFDRDVTKYGLLPGNKTKYDDPEPPKIYLYADVSGSWSGDEIKLGEQFTRLLEKWGKEGIVDYELFYFGNIVSKSISEAGGGTNIEAVANHIRENHPQNVIIMTDDDSNSINSHLELPGGFWLITKPDSSCNNLFAHIHTIKPNTKHRYQLSWEQIKSVEKND